MTDEQKRIIRELKQLDIRLKKRKIQEEFKKMCRWDRLLGFYKNIDNYYIRLDSSRAVREYLKKKERRL